MPELVIKIEFKTNVTDMSQANGFVDGFDFKPKQIYKV